MRTDFLSQCPTTPNPDNLQSFLRTQINKEQFDTARVATAYATVSGVRALLTAFEQHGLCNSLWLLGLDDAVTQPGAIELLMSLENAEVRVASHEDKNFRFHPKFFAFGQAGESKKQLSLIGSANLTASALCGNAEAVAILESQDEKDRTSVDAVWSSLWIQGHKPSKAELDAYKEKYEKAATLRQQYKTIAKKPKTTKSKEVLASDEAELDPSIASICWIECGNVTAMGRELEFKAEQGLFFGLNPSGGGSKTVTFKVSDGTTTNLVMKYQGNHMWRLQMNNTVPEVKDGLRPKDKNGKLGRSPYVAVFRRGNKGQSISLGFVHLKDKNFSALRKQTIETGTLGKTTAREYGWC
jgi:HKD family nuclease